MTAALRTVITFSALLLVNMASAAGQIAARATYVEDGSFDLPPAGPTSPTIPAAIAVGPDGALHIVDRRGQVMVFDRSGTPVRAYGGGSLTEPVAVAVDEFGRAYVLDKELKRILVFDEEGEEDFVVAGGGRGASRLEDPVSMAFGPGGFLYVLDQGDKSIGLFSRDGAFVRQVRLGAVIRDLIGIAIGGDGQIFLAADNRGALVFTMPAFSEMPWQSSSSHRVLSLGPIEEATAIAVDGSGTVVVLDGRQGRIWGGSRLDPEAPAPNRALYGGVGSIRGSFRAPVGIAFTPERHLVVLDRDLRKVERIELTEGVDAPPLEWDYPIRVSQLPPNPVGAVTAVGPPGDGVARFVMASPGNLQLRVEQATLGRYLDRSGEVFESYSAPDSVGPETWFMGFQRPPGAVALNDTLLVVTEPERNRVHLFDASGGEPLGMFGHDYGDDRRLKKPVGIALFSNGSIAVADRDNHRVAIFSADMTALLASFAVRDAWGVAVSPDDELFAWPQSGESLLRIPLRDGPPQAVAYGFLWGGVRDIEFDAQGNLFILERGTSRVTVLDASLERVLVRMGGRFPRFGATHLSLDAHGNVYMANPEEGRSLVYRWDARLPELETLRAALSADGVAFSWEPLDSEYVWGYRVSGATTREGPFQELATTTGGTFDLTLDEDFEYRWLRVDPVSMTGSTSSSDQPIPVAHRIVREAAARNGYSEVLDAVTSAESLNAQGVLTLASDVAQELQWFAFSTEFQVGRYAEAVAREEALEGWQGEDRGLELHRLLAIAHSNLGQYGPALENVHRALESMPVRERADEAGVEVLQLGMTAAFETEAFREVVAFGEELQGRVGPDREYQLYSRVAAGHLALDNPERANQIARTVINLDRSGQIQAYDEERQDLYWVAVRASMALSDSTLMRAWAREYDPYLTDDRRPPYHEALAHFWASQGQGAQALTNFQSLLETTSETEFFTDSATVDLTFSIFRALQDEDIETRSAGLTFLAGYAAELPDEVEELRLAYQDSIALFEPREDTLLKLGEGFQYWHEVNFAGLIGFFEGAIEQGGLTFEQEKIARALLAGAYQSAGRGEDAESTYRGILDLDPLFDIDGMVSRVEDIYGIRVFDEQTIEIFRSVRRIR